MTGLENYTALGLIGVGGGLISGAVGLAGGIFIVPALIAIYGTNAMGDAIVVSFFAVLFNSLSATIENRKARGRENFWNLIGSAHWYTLGAIFAALSVAVVFGRHKDSIPKGALAGLQLLLAACMLIPRSWYQSSRLKHGKVKDGFVGAIVGGISTLIGVGGGTYTIAYFMTHGREIKDCTLTANFVGFFIGLMSLIGYYSAVTFATAGVVASSASAIDWSGKTVLILAGIVASPMGVKIQNKLPATAIKKIIVVALAISSMYVLLKA